MNIREFSVELQKIYLEMKDSFSSYQAASGLPCLTGCGKCCQNPDIEVSVWEMIPMALRLSDEGKLEEWFERIESSGQEHCLMYLPTTVDGTQGKCQYYNERPSICRMFGVAGFSNKHGNVSLSVCKIIRDKYPEQVKEQENLASIEKTPMLSQWSYKMAELNPQLIQNRMPINKALKIALEKVALYARYQDQS